MRDGCHFLEIGRSSYRSWRVSMPSGGLNASSKPFFYFSELGIICFNALKRAECIELLHKNIVPVFLISLHIPTISLNLSPVNHFLPISPLHAFPAGANPPNFLHPVLPAQNQGHSSGPWSWRHAFRNSKCTRQILAACWAPITCQACRNTACLPPHHTVPK